MRFRGEVLVCAPLTVAWDALADLASHVEWMADAETITFTSDQRRGVGTTFVCRTRVGPLRTADEMTVTQWEEKERIAVAHRGIVRGVGVFELAEIGPDLTRICWSEDLTFPFWAGGAAGTFAAKPVLRRIWQGNLSRFKEIVARSYRSH